MNESQLDAAEEMERLTVTITRAPEAQTISYSLEPKANLQTDNEIVEQNQNFLDNQRLALDHTPPSDKILGAGGQGKVYLSQRRGATPLFRSHQGIFAGTLFQ